MKNSDEFYLLNASKTLCFEVDTGKNSRTKLWLLNSNALLVTFQNKPSMFSPSSGTVADNIRYGPQLRGKKLSDDEVHKLLSLADLDSSFFSKIGSELSVGQAQRVALARTLANTPEVFYSHPLHSLTFCK